MMGVLQQASMRAIEPLRPGTRTYVPSVCIGVERHKKEWELKATFCRYNCLEPHRLSCDLIPLPASTKLGSRLKAHYKGQWR